MDIMNDKDFKALMMKELSEDLGFRALPYKCTHMFFEHWQAELCDKLIRAGWRKVIGTKAEE